MRRAVKRNDIVVIVDVLSFSSAVTTAVHHDALICPCPETENSTDLARQFNGVATVRRKDVPQKGQFSLSPLTYLDLEKGTRIVMNSLNGGRCCKWAEHAPHLFIGALVNAKAVADVITKISARNDSGITIIACGEQDPRDTINGELRMAVEDYLGAGAILSYLRLKKSAEALVCEGAFLRNKDSIKEIIRHCISGRELRAIGFSEDVEHCSRLDSYDCVPVVQNGIIVKYST